MATIKDIAKKAGVSPASVSRVLNYDKTFPITDKTRKKIFEAAEALSYKKQAVKRSKEKRIMIVHWYTETEELNDLYYLSIRLGIESKCKNLNLQMSVCFFDNIADVTSDEVDGIIAIGHFNKEQIEQLKTIHPTIVFVDSSPDEDVYDSVVINFHKATRKAIDYFLETNHKQIGFIGGKSLMKEKPNKYVEPRAKMYYRYMTEKGLFHEKNMFMGEFSVDGGYQLMKEAITTLGERLPTAFFVSSDILAIGCLRALHEAGIAVPGRVSIIGLNDISVSKHMYPPLSTVKVYTDMMGEMSVDLLMERLCGRQVAKTVYVATKLVVRDSVR